MRVLPAMPTPAMRRQRCADPHVVPHVHQVVQLGPAADDRVVDAAPVDAGVGADLHLILQDAAPHVRDPAMPRGAGEIAETVAAEHRARLDTTRLPMRVPGVAHHPRADDGVIPDDNPVAQSRPPLPGGSGRRAARPGPAPRSGPIATSCPSARPRRYARWDRPAVRGARGDTARRTWTSAPYGISHDDPGAGGPGASANASGTSTAPPWSSRSAA